MGQLELQHEAHKARLARMGGNGQCSHPWQAYEPKKAPAPKPKPSVEQWVTRQKEIWFSIVEEIEPREPTLENIIRAVAAEFGVDRVALMSARRTADIILPRHITFYLARHLTVMSLPAIGRFVGKRDHTTVLHSVRKIERELASDADLQERIDRIKKALGQ